MAISTEFLGDVVNFPSPIVEGRMLALKIEADLDSAVYHGNTSVWVPEDILRIYKTYRLGKESREDFLQTVQDTLARKYVYESNWTSLHIKRRACDALVVELVK